MQSKSIWLARVVYLLGLIFCLNISVVNQVFAAPQGVPKAILLDFASLLSKHYAVDLQDKIYPIGWSKTGKFAYYREIDDEACGCYRAEVVIQDLKQDKVVFAWKYDGQESQAENMSTVWQKHRNLLQKALITQGIIATNFSGKYGVNTGTNYGNYQTKLVKKMYFSTDFGLNMVEYATLYLSKRNRQNKTILSKNFRNQLYLDMRVVGSFLSPYEARMAYIVGAKRRGWEGPPHVLTFFVVGGKLE